MVTQLVVEWHKSARCRFGYFSAHNLTMIRSHLGSSCGTRLEVRKSFAFSFTTCHCLACFVGDLIITSNEGDDPKSLGTPTALSKSPPSGQSGPPPQTAPFPPPKPSSSLEQSEAMRREAVAVAKAFG